MQNGQQVTQKAELGLPEMGPGLGSAKVGINVSSQVFRTVIIPVIS